MSDRPWWSHVLQWGAWLLILTLVMRWLERSRAVQISAGAHGFRAGVRSPPRRHGHA